VFIKATAQSALALSHFPSRLADINQLTLEIKGIDSAERRGDTFRQREKRTGFQLFDKLGADAPI